MVGSDLKQSFNSVLIQRMQMAALPKCNVAEMNTRDE